MSDDALPVRPSLEYLKRLAKDRLRSMRQADPDARLAAAQRAVAREHGFPSWRALRAEVERRLSSPHEAFFAACAIGDVATLRGLLDETPELATSRNPDGATGLHLAVRHPDAVRLLLKHGADPDARDVGDNAPPLFGALGGPIESVHALLDGGADVHGTGDLHQLELIGAATVFGEPNREIVDLLLRYGARHHVFSAIALGDVTLLRQVVAAEPAALRRRLSRFEQEQSALHYVIAPPDGLLGGTFRTGGHYDMLDALIALGADLEALDTKGRTPMMLAMLLGDQEAMRRLQAAGARQPEAVRADALPPLASLAAAMGPIAPKLAVADVEATVAWYQEIGFALTGSHQNGGRMDWAEVRFGRAEVMFVPAGHGLIGPEKGLSLWIRTERLDELYQVLKQRQLARARDSLAGKTPDGQEVRFIQDLHIAFYGQREFGVRDPNGVDVMFFQPLES